MNSMHGIIFACGVSQNLRELCAHRLAVSVPFGGRYRMADFMLSNMQNAGITNVGVIMNGNYQSLLNHLGSGKIWDMSRKHGGLRLLPAFLSPEQARYTDDFRGRMEALAGIRGYLQEIREKHIVLSNGSLIANLPLSDIYEAHIRSGNDITAVCAPSGAVRAGEIFFRADESGRLTMAQRAASDVTGLRALEVYILHRDLLLQLVERCMQEERYSFHHDVLERMAQILQIGTFVFEGYCAVVQTALDYYQSSMDMLRMEVRRDLFNETHPIRGKEDDWGPSYFPPEGCITRSLIANGCEIEGEVKNSILFPGVRVEKGAVVHNCVLFKNTVVRRGAHIHHIIADKRVIFSENAAITGTERYPVIVARDSTV